MKFTSEKNGLRFIPSNDTDRLRFKEIKFEVERMKNDFLLTPSEAELKHILIRAIETGTEPKGELFNKCMETFKRVEILFGDPFLCDKYTPIDRFLNIYYTYFDTGTCLFVVGEKRVKMWVNELKAIGYEQ